MEISTEITSNKQVRVASMTHKMTYKPVAGFVQSLHYKEAKEKVYSHSNSSDGRLCIHILKGISGIGKTQIGRKLISDVRTSGMNGFEVDSSDEEKMQNSLREIMNYKRLNFTPTGVGEDLVTIANQIPEAGLVLFLVDNPELKNCEEHESWFWSMIVDIKDHHINDDKKVVVLVTTRIPPPRSVLEASNDHCAIEVQNVQGFDQEESKDFLIKEGVARHILECSEGMKRLHEMYHGHPMSLNADVAIFKGWGDPDELKVYVDQDFCHSSEMNQTDASQTITKHLLSLNPIHLEIWKILALFDQGNLHKDIVQSVIICYIKQYPEQFRNQFQLPENEDDMAYQRTFYKTLQRIYGSMIEEMLYNSYITELRQSKKPQQIYLLMHPLVHESLNYISNDTNEQQTTDNKHQGLRLALVALSRVVDIDNRFHYMDSAVISKLQHSMKHSETILSRLVPLLDEDKLSLFEELAVFELVSSIAYAKMRQPSFKDRAEEPIQNLTSYVEKLKHFARIKADRRAGSVAADNTADNTMSDYELVARYFRNGSEEERKTAELQCEEFMKFRRFPKRDLQKVLQGHLNPDECYIPALFLRISRKDLNKMRESLVLLPLERFMDIYPLEIWAQMLTFQGKMHQKNNENDKSLRCYNDALDIYKEIAKDDRPPKKLLHGIVLERDHKLKNEVKRRRVAAAHGEPSDDDSALLKSYEELRHCEDKAFEKGYLRSHLCEDNYHIINCYECMLEILGCMYHGADTTAKEKYFRGVERNFTEMKVCIQKDEHPKRCYAYAIKSLAKALSLCGDHSRKYTVRALAFSLVLLQQNELEKMNKGEKEGNPHPEINSKCSETFDLLQECKHLEEQAEVATPTPPHSYRWLSCLCLEETCAQTCSFPNIKRYLKGLRRYIVVTEEALAVLKLNVETVKDILDWAIDALNCTDQQMVAPDSDDNYGVQPVAEEN